MCSPFRPGTASMSVTNVNAKLMTFDTSLSYTEVVVRLDEAINKQGSGGILMKLKSAKSREEINEVVNAITKLENDFLYFLDIRHHPWLNIYYETTTTPSTVLYTIGNPLIAQTILRHDLRAGLHIPPRLLVQEKADGKGTLVMYQLPSSVMVIPNEGGVNENEELKRAVKSLDEKFEALAKKVVGMEEKQKL
ncbi:hypothetical protein D9756_000681 [Leucocoprinus leucothites]|uniref:DUF302 domain-containing protein n=1 Tax=Leucocoprinus leucothites TaxID=201217 RepID=A0A8H5LN08_9AGAR|nr:hypothetical protein D9756_000681 [Leucoagaricus leucothites]